MFRAALLVLVGAVGLAGTGTAVTADGERWQRLVLPAEAGPPQALGLLRFPDGQTGIWVGTANGNFRRVQEQWQPWPPAFTDGALRAAVVAPDVAGRTAWWLLGEQGLWQLRIDGELERVESDELGQQARSLHVEQGSGAAPAELWLAGPEGLLRYAIGSGRAELVTFPAFPSGEIIGLRALRLADREQLWLATAEGLARRSEGVWQRYGRECLRGRRVLGLEPLRRDERVRLVVLTRPGPILLDPLDPDHCEALEFAEGDWLAAVADRRGRLLLAGLEQVFRVWPRERGEADGWTRFDARDGLEGFVPLGAAIVDPEGAVLFAAAEGLWRLPDREPPDPAALPAARLELLGAVRQALNPLDLPRLNPGVHRFALDWGEGSRVHARHWRLTAENGSDRDPGWHEAQAPIELALPQGRTTLELQRIDEYGRIQRGPRYSFEAGTPAPSPLRWVLVALVLGASLVAVLAWRYTRSP